MATTDFIEQLRKKRDVIIVVLINLLVLVLIIVGLKMQKHYGASQQPEEGSGPPPEKVTLSAARSAADKEQQASPAEATAYFLKPTPAEILQLVRESGQAQLPKDSQKYIRFKVIWPCYFFQVLKQEDDRATVLLDVDENGFGPTIVTDVDIQHFPEILSVSQGQKVWVGGEIIDIDPTGTGTIHIVSDEIRLQDELPEVTAATASEKEQDL
ncbi:MAG: hypothetical protein ACK5PS_14925 [Desulfopila sp.]